MLAEVLSWDLAQTQRRAIAPTAQVQEALIPRLIESQSQLANFDPESEPRTTEGWVADIKKVRCTYYRTLSGQDLLAGCFIFHQSAPEGLTYLLRASPANSARILSDITIRLENLRDCQGSNPEEYLHEFATALYGYYQAYPLQVGTHEFGWAIFSGFFKARFRRELIPRPLESTLVEWLALSKSGFIESLLVYMNQ